MTEKSTDKKIFMTVVTVIMLVLSTASIALFFYLKSYYASKNSTTKQVKAVLSDAADFTSDSVSAGDSFSRTASVKITQGEGFVRFNVILLDSDGVSFNSKLVEKKAEIDDYKSRLDPDSPSYQAFFEAYYRLLGEYNVLFAKATVAFTAFCRTDDNVPIVDDDSDFYQMYDSDYPFDRTFVYEKKLKKGESCELYSKVVIPESWTEDQTAYRVYEINESGGMYIRLNAVDNITLLGDGFGLNVSVDVVDAGDFDSALAAFNTADVVTAVTEISSSS